MRESGQVVDRIRVVGACDRQQLLADRDRPIEAALVLDPREPGLEAVQEEREEDGPARIVFRREGHGVLAVGDGPFEVGEAPGSLEPPV